MRGTAGGAPGGQGRDLVRGVLHGVRAVGAVAAYGDAGVAADGAGQRVGGDFCIDIGRNICHGSDTVENAEKEIALWFPEGTNAWTSHSQSWIYE